VVESSPGPPLRGAYSPGRARRGPGRDRRRTGPAHQRAGGYSAPEEDEVSCHQVRLLTAAPPSAWRETPASPPFSRDRSPHGGPARSRVVHSMWGLIHSRPLDPVGEYALLGEQLTRSAGTSRPKGGRPPRPVGPRSRAPRCPRCRDDGRRAPRSRGARVVNTPQQGRSSFPAASNTRKPVFSSIQSACAPFAEAPVASPRPGCRGCWTA
jgi:hypothetical protein